MLARGRLINTSRLLSSNRSESWAKTQLDAQLVVVGLPFFSVQFRDRSENLQLLTGAVAQECGIANLSIRSFGWAIMQSQLPRFYPE